MKKFRLFAMLAVLATFSTVFAAWNFMTYADTYTSEPIKITVSEISTVINEGQAIEITASAPAAISVSYEQLENNSYIAKATVSGSVNVQVKENVDGAASDYTYSYKVYAGGSNIADRSKLTTEDAATATPITLDDNGAATISAEEIAEYFDIDFGKQPTTSDLETMNARLAATLNSGETPGAFITVYATKK